MIESQEIHPLNDFLRDHERHLARLVLHVRLHHHREIAS